MIYLATTTINKPTLALRKFAKNNNCKLIVALDKKSKKFNLKNTFVLSTNYQEKKWPKLSNLIGWNCIQRRNFAILEALERGAEIIALVDDDNIPFNNWFRDIYVNRVIKAWKIKTNKKVFDPIGYTNKKKLWHRGFPLELIQNRKYNKIGKKKLSPDVQASFWDLEPDVDAVARLVLNTKSNNGFINVNDILGIVKMDDKDSTDEFQDIEMFKSPLKETGDTLQDVSPVSFSGRTLIFKL